MLSEVPERWNRPIFMASLGRSGSTLLQRLLNVHPGITIWGEHGGFLKGVLQSYGDLSEPATVTNLESGYESRADVLGELENKDSFKPWVSPFTAPIAKHAMANMVRSLFTAELDPTMRWGFKEIRYDAAQISPLMEMFPHAKVMILARDLRGHAQSRFFAFGNTNFDLTTDDGRAAAIVRLQNISKGWIERYQGLLEASERFEGRASIVAYNDLVVGSARPAALFTELGESPPAQGALDAVLEAVAGSSYKFNAAARENREMLAALHEEADVDWDEANRLSQILGV